MMIDPIRRPAIDETLALILSPVTNAVAPVSQPLDELFHTLKHAEDSLSRTEAEDLIWALWCSHEDRSAERQMHHSIGALNRRDFDKATRLLDDLVERWPQWAEAWNKRATLAFLLEDDEASVADIQRTLSLEHRHFGAICGFAQICLRAGDPDSALIAFESALAINPNMSGVSENAAMLRARGQRVVH